MPAHFQAAHAKDRKSNARHDVEQRQGRVTRKQRLNEVREQEAGGAQRRKGNFMASIGYSYEE